MSALRKLRQLKQAAESPAAAAPSVAEEEPVPLREPTRPPAGNAFAGLLDEEEEEAEAQREEEPEKPQEKEADENVAAEEEAAEEAASADAPAAAASQSKNKKNKKAKAKSEAVAAAPAPAASGAGGKKKKGAAAAVAAAPEKEDWELEFATPSDTPAAAAASSGSSGASAASASSGVWDVLRTEARLLDAQAEVRAVFGSGFGGGRGGGGGEDDDGEANRAAMHGRNQGGFRRGGAALVRRTKATAGGSGAASSFGGMGRRMLVRPNPAWSRAEGSGLLKAHFVAPMDGPPTPPAAVAATKTKASGMHGNIHSLADASATAAADAGAGASDPAALEQQRLQEQAAAEYDASLQRWQRQQQLVMGPGVRQYTFVHSGEFRHQQEEYALCVASMDVQQLARFSQMHPFHPEAALSMSDIFTSQSEFATAAELVARALFVHESAWQGTEMGDKIAQGLARIDVTPHENQAFFTALARHAQALGKRGCPRTALEVSKLLLSLSPLLDPSSALLSIDFYALRSKQFAWLRDFAAQMDRAIISAYGVGQHPWAGAGSASAAAAAAAPSKGGANIATLSSPAAAASAAAAVAVPSSAASASSSAVASSVFSPPPRAPATFLPNLMYSRALAAWHMENAAATAEEKKGGRGGGKGASASAAAAAPAASALFTGAVQPPALPATAAGHSMLDADEAAALASAESSTDAQSSSYLLQQALLMYPSVVAPLLTAAGAESALSRPVWVSALAALQELYPAASPSAYLDKLQLCFVERSASLWKNDRIQAWLLANAQQLATVLSASPSLYSPSLLARFAAARQRFLLSIPIPATVRNLQKSAYSDHVAQLPPELLMAQQHAGMEQWAAGERARQRAADLAANGMQPLDLAQSPLRVFMQSLLPWFAPPEAGAGAVAGEEGNEEEQMAALERQLAALPADQQQQLMRVLGAEQGEEGEADDQQHGDDGGAGLGDYADYEFDD